MGETLAARLAASLSTGWASKARPEQLPPPGQWFIWLICAGRGWGKSRTGAEWVLSQVRAGRRRIALLGTTAADCRDVMIEGESGILACSPAHDMPEYEPSKRRLTWKNGAIATCYSSEEPRTLRGPQHDAAWVDELAAQDPGAWEMMLFGLRLGKHPQICVTTTPRPTKLIKDLVARDGKDVVLTRGKTMDNRANLAPSFIETIVAPFEGTRLGRQELDAELLFDTPGALWSLDMLDRSRVKAAPELRRVVVAIDPAVSTGEGSDLTGICVAGLDRNGHVYVLADLSGKYQPHEWAAKAVKAYKEHKADRIIAETNNGGDLVENTLRVVNSSIPYKKVHASRGKVTRAEPVAALFEQGKAHLVGTLPDLEAQMTEFTSDFSKKKAGYSPDRVDAMVWALTELAVKAQSRPAKFINFNIMGR